MIDKIVETLLVVYVSNLMGVSIIHCFLIGFTAIVFASAIHYFDKKKKKKEKVNP